MQTSLDHQEIVRFIIDQINKGEKDDTILENLNSKFAINQNISEWALEMTRTGYLRACFKMAGKQYPKSNTEKDPFLQFAVKLIMDELEKNSGSSHT